MRQRTIRTLVRASLVILVAAAAGCTTKREDLRGGGDMSGIAGMAPMLTVERFLQAANARDLDAMSRLFGTYDGPIKGDRQEMELRMSAISQVLRHDDYRVTGQRSEPGRQHPTTRVAVTLSLGRRVVPEVPFMVVRTADGQWLVEQIDLERITRGG